MRIAQWHNMHQQATELMLLEVDEVELQLETALLPPLTSPAPSASPLRPNHLQGKETTLYFCSPATFVFNAAHLEHHALAVRTNGEHAALQLLSTRLSRADHAPPDVVLCSSQTLMILIHCIGSAPMCAQILKSIEFGFELFQTCGQPCEAEQCRRW